MSEKLLTRDEFREKTFQRDKNVCVMCGSPAKDAHHILERRLFKSPEEMGGYFLSNGSSLCEVHHIEAEKTLISVEEIREKCGITKPTIPQHLYTDMVYDKWGNIVQENGTRIRGELYSDESVQKILADVKHLYVNYIKYPRTWHLVCSPGMHDDDRSIKDYSNFVGQHVTIEIKKDGENTSIYSDGYIHARSIDGRNHWSRDWVKNFAQNWCYDLPEDYHVCGENLYATHSIRYDDLESYFFGFSMWNGLECLSVQETKDWFELLGIQHVPVLYEGIFDEKILNQIIGNMDFEKQEGFVIRLSDAFHYKDFHKSVAKYVRPNHVRTINHHWMFHSLETNKLKDQ